MVVYFCICMHVCKHVPYVNQELFCFVTRWDIWEKSLRDGVHTKYFLSLESEASEQYIILTLIEAAMIRPTVNQFVSHMILLSFYRVLVCLQQIRYYPEELERCVPCGGQLPDLTTWRVKWEEVPDKGNWWVSHRKEMILILWLYIAWQVTC